MGFLYGIWSVLLASFRSESKCRFEDLSRDEKMSFSRWYLANISNDMFGPVNATPHQIALYLKEAQASKKEAEEAFRYRGN